MAAQLLAKYTPGWAKEEFWRSDTPPTGMRGGGSRLENPIRIKLKRRNTEQEKPEPGSSAHQETAEEEVLEEEAEQTL